MLWGDVTELQAAAGCGDEAEDGCACGKAAGAEMGEDQAMSHLGMGAILWGYSGRPGCKTCLSVPVRVVDSEDEDDDDEVLFPRPYVQSSQHEFLERVCARRQPDA